MSPDGWAMAYMVAFGGLVGYVLAKWWGLA